MTNTTVATKRDEVSGAMMLRTQELEQAQEAIKQVVQEGQDAKQEGNATVAEMQEQINELKESMKIATDISEMTLLDKQVEGLEKDVKLQGMLLNGALVKKKEELEQAFDTFYSIYKEASKTFKALDTEFAETMSMRTYEDDVALVDGYARIVNSLFDKTRSALHSQGFVTLGEQFYKGVHLSPRGLYAENESLRMALRKSLDHKSVMARFM